MTRTFQQLQAEITKLQAQADKVRAAERAGAVSQVRETIALFGMSQHELFGAKAAGPAATGKVRGAGKKSTKAKSSAPKYQDGKGGTWGGIGKRPQWLHAALANGAKLEDFLASNIDAAPAAAVAPEAAPGADASAAAVESPAAPAVKRAAKKVPAAKKAKAAAAAKPKKTKTSTPA